MTPSKKGCYNLCGAHDQGVEGYPRPS
jgi:hypothetical protein